MRRMNPQAPVVVLALLLSAAPGRAADAEAEAARLNNQAVKAAEAGQLKEGIALLRQALAADPADSTARRNLSAVLVQQIVEQHPSLSQQELLRLAREAVLLDEANGAAWSWVGNLSYQQGDFSGAIEGWQKALPQAPADRKQPLADAIASAQRDSQIEREFASRRLEHFTIYFGKARPSDVDRLEALLKQAYETLLKEHGREPGRTSVVIYPVQDLDRVADDSQRALGLYDGRIRLAFGDLNQAHLEDTVIHELSHAFLHRLYLRKLPRWVDEGYAQFHQKGPPTNAELQARLEQGLRSGSRWIPLQWLDRHFEQPLDAEDRMRAYAQSRLVVQQLIGRHGMDKFVQFLQLLGAGAGVEEAHDRAFAPLRFSRLNRGLFD